MKRTALAIFLLFGWASAAFAAPSGTLTTLRAIHRLTNAEAHNALPVAFEATVTFERWYDQALFVEDNGVSIYVQCPLEAKFAPGDRVLVRGKTHDSFRPEVLSDSITLLRHGSLPKSSPANFDQLIRSQFDCALVTVRGVIRTADLAGRSMFTPERSITLEMLTDGGLVQINLNSGDESVLPELLDAQVEITGVAVGNFDGMMQLVGIVLNVSSLADVHILKHAGVSPWSYPAVPMDEILTRYHENILTQRVLVHGVITYDQPGVMVILQSGGKTTRILTESYTPLRIGDQADATGFPNLVDGFLSLTNAEVQDNQTRAPIQPQSAAWEDLSSGTNIFSLVSVEGEVVMEAREAAQDEYVLVSGGHLFSVLYHHPVVDAAIPLAPMKQVPIGSKVRVTGICEPFSADAFSGPVPFDILLRTFDDITVIARPSLLNIRNLMLSVGLLLIVVIAVGAWGWVLKKKVHRQTRALSIRIEAEAITERRTAQLEQQRSHILEEINGTAPLAGILEEITRLVSFCLNGAPCWCEVTDGARLGEFPQMVRNMRVIHKEILSRTGAALGKLFAAFAAETPPSEAENEALLVSTRLATLAIETRRLYTDLMHRSEFDLLTDIHNRFAMEKRLEAQIEEARRNAGVFGLIYIDLDRFKQVNDIYGHHVGDLYLQEATRRMKQQLRSHDLLARLGGDEFAVLLPMVRNRAEVEEVALRLECCFGDPLFLEGHTLQGSASLGIALYPEDSATADSLLSAADAAMYEVKRSHRLAEKIPARQEEEAPTT